MTGVLILAAGVPRAFVDTSFGVITIGYVVMRLAMVALWLRAAVQHPEGRACALRYADRASRAADRLGRCGSRCPTPPGCVAFFLLATLELCVPLWAEQVGRTAWHPGHIAERYGLFTIIVLGESVLSATVGVQTAIDLDSKFSDLGLVVVGGLLTLFAMWWIYFDLPTEHLVERIRADFPKSIWALRSRGVTATTSCSRRSRRRARAWWLPSISWRATPSSPTCRPRSRSRCPCRCTCSRCGCCTRATRPRAGAQLRAPVAVAAHLAVDLHVRAGARDRCCDGRVGRVNVANTSAQSSQKSAGARRTRRPRPRRLAASTRLAP